MPVHIDNYQYNICDITKYVIAKMVFSNLATWDSVFKKLFSVWMEGQNIEEKYLFSNVVSVDMVINWAFIDHKRLRAQNGSVAQVNETCRQKL